MKKRKKRGEAAISPPQSQLLISGILRRTVSG
jgi:hypothetical protein